MAQPTIGNWLTTAPNPKRHRTFYGDDGVTGWKLHFVPPDSAIAICGLRPKHGWGIDSFIDEKCIKCLNAIGEGRTALPAPEPFTHYSIHHCDTHKLFWEGRDKEEAAIEAKFAAPHSEHYITEWLGIGNDSDEIIEQVSVDEWLCRTEA